MEGPVEIAEIVEPEDLPTIIQEGHRVWARVERNGQQVIERVPRQVLEWGEKAQVQYFTEVAKRMRIKLNKVAGRERD